MELFRSLSLSKVGCLFIAFSLFCFSLNAEPLDPPAPQAVKNIRFVLEVYTLKKGDAARLMKETGIKPELYRQVRALTESGVAKLETLIATTSCSGQPFSARQVDEIPFPTEFHPSLSAGDPPFPIHYETEYVGETLECESLLAVDRDHYDLNFVFSSDRLEGFSEPGTASPETRYGEPMIRKRSVSTSQTFTTGSAQFIGKLAGSFLPGADISSESEERRWLFGRVDAVEAGPLKSDAAMDAGSAAPQYDPQVEIYSLDRDTAWRVLAENSRPGASYAAVKRLVEQNEARLEQSVSGLGTPLKSGQQHDLFACKNQVRVPVDYELTVDGTSQPPKDSSNPAPFHKIGNATGYPVAFVTRDEGLHIEFLPVSQPGGLVNVTVKPRYEQSVGDLQTEGVATRFPAHPVFQKHEAETSFFVTPGEISLAGTLNPPGGNGVNGRKDSGRVWLCFVRVDRAK